MLDERRIGSRASTRQVKNWLGADFCFQKPR